MKASAEHAFAEQRTATCRDNRTRALPAFWPNREVSRFVSAAGACWHVQRMGRGETVLLIHGTGSSTHSWRRVMPGLATGFDVLAIDLPGHGFSSPLPDSSMALADVADGVNALLTTMAVSPRAVVGHSAGAAVALEVGRRYLDDLHSCIGINAALLPYGGPLARIFAPLARIVALAPFVPGWVANRARDPKLVNRYLRGTGSSLDADGVALYQYLFSQAEHVRATVRMMADWNLHGLLDSMAPIADRVHLLVGSADTAIAPSQAKLVKRRHRQIEISLLDGLGHLAQEEAPTLVTDRLRRILGSPHASGR